MAEKFMKAERRHRAMNAGFVRQVLLWPLALLLAWGMVYYNLGVLLPLRKNVLHVDRFAGGAWSDLYHEWFGAQALLRHGRNPYSAEITQEIERGFYGADRYNAKQFGYPQAFVYPVYVVFLFAPFLHLSFETVRLIFKVVFFLFTVASVPLWIRTLKLHLGTSTTLLILLITLSSYSVIDGLGLEQLTMLVAGLIALSLAAMDRGYLGLGSMLLAFATVKPHLVIPLAGFLFFWTLGAWRERKRLAMAFVGTMAVILIASELVLPGWFWLWLQATQAYAGYVKPSLLQGMLGRTGGTIAGILSVLACLVMFWRLRKAPGGSAAFVLSVVAALVLTVILVPAAGGAKYNQVLLIPGAILLFLPGKEFVPHNRTARLTRLLAVTVLTGEWILAFLVSFAALVLRHTFHREDTFFVAGPEFLMYLFPLTLGLFMLSIAPQVLAETRAKSV